VAETNNLVKNKYQEITEVSIRLASPDTIRNWSFGEVTKPETINYRSFKPERDGLFCEKIFGPVRNWECNCGKYKRIRYRGVVCDRCGVEVTHSKVRRERMGHIELAVPVVHIWFLKNVPSYISYILGLPNTVLERIAYYESYIVLDPGDTNLRKYSLITEEDYIKLEEEKKQFVAKMGGEAILEMLATLDLEELGYDLRSKIKIESSEQRKQEHLKRLKIVEAFIKSGNKPEHMVLKVLPVLPPDLRPLVPLEGGRFATADLNDLYRRVINRNNRLKKLQEIKAPDVILRNEMRMLQEAVDTLFDNGRRTFSVKGEGKRPLKSLSDLLKGKQGRFRQNLLGKRVDYSGRSVIVVGPELKLHQCGLPKSMALELFKPFVIQKLEEKNLAQTVKSAKRFVEKERPEVWDILEEVIKDHPVMLNRAPTLHRLGIQAFFPVLVEGKAIRLHPLVCAAFNADFDGDQMAVHVPLSFESQIECRFLMLSANNLLNPASGIPIMVPSQDIVLGIYYLTKISPNQKGEGRIFADSNEVLYAVFNKQIDIHAQIKVRINGKLIETTAGRVIFNQIMPEGIDYCNELLNKKKIQNLVATIIKKKGNKVACKFLDDIKSLGYEYATRAGVTFGSDDLVIPSEKKNIIDKALEESSRIKKQYDRGIITEGERYNKIIDLWTHTTSKVADSLREALQNDKNGFNPVFMMLDSGARGSNDQIKQLAGMRGLMQKPQKKITGAVGEIIENPIISNFKDGLSVLEYFISTHGARKGLADTALKTADAGYLTRRLVDVVQDIIITQDDCGTIKGIEIEELREGDEIMEPLSGRILGRVTLEDIYDPANPDQIICPANTLIDEKLAKKIEDAGYSKIKIRSVLTCDAREGVCAKCYGRNLATGKLVDIGEAVGIMAAQSIGEPGTQLTLRTFHIGGTASRLILKEKEFFPYNNLEHGKFVVKAKVKFVDLDIIEHKNGNKAMSRSGEIVIEMPEKEYRYNIPYGAFVFVKDNQEIVHPYPEFVEDKEKSKNKPLFKEYQKKELGIVLFQWDPYNSLILAPENGTIKLVDFIEGETIEKVIDERTQMSNLVVIDSKDRKLHPHIEIWDNDKRVASITAPTGAFLGTIETDQKTSVLKTGDKVSKGDILLKVPRETGKSKDITGGLPRVAELFEARTPKNSAVISEVNGIVEIGQLEKRNRKVFVKDENGKKHEYLIPTGKHLRVHDGDRVKAGDRLSEGAINPHDILRILGENAVQKYLLDEIQAVYRLQGVTINDKHIEVIISQMLDKVRIEDPGDTNFLEDEIVGRHEIKDVNEQVVSEGGKPATFKPVLLGITRASLTTDSFFSAASFQETTKVLSKAAIEGKVDKLKGLKENLIMGNLIPAGTGNKIYRNIYVKDLSAESVPIEKKQTDEDFLELGL
jgi:DNA-directed RNA polymerase subunit beta'